METLADKVALVTGGASGIGLATARRLAAGGAHVVVADRDADAGPQVAADLSGSFLPLDVGDPAGWATTVEKVMDVHGRLDVVHLNAGVTTGQADMNELTDEQYRRVLGANVDGVVFGTRAVTRAMEASGGGAIVVTASLAGLIAFAPDPIYTLTKHAVVGFVRSVAPQLLGRGITINAVCPSVVDTPLVGDARALLVGAGFPLIDPADIAEAVVQLVLGRGTGECWTCQHGVDPSLYEFNPVSPLAAGG